MEHLESVYTSTNRKLMRHCNELAWIGPGECVWKPITLHISPTDKCNLNCDFCSVRDREGDELDFEKLKRCIDDFVGLGIKSVEITGGGEPTLYPDISELIDAITERRIYPDGGVGHTSAGMITNGLMLAGIPDRTLRKLTWIRVSLSALDQDSDALWASLEGNLEGVRLARDVTLGMSYVVHQNTTSEVALEIHRLVDEYNPAYLRLVPNCLTEESMRRAKTRAYKYFGCLIDEGRAFFQTKDARVPESCYIGYLKPFLNSDGWIYMCSTSPLFARKFPKEFRLCRMENVWEYWDALGESNNTGFDTSICQKCFYADQNDLIADLRREIPHEEFI